LPAAHTPRLQPSVVPSTQVAAQTSPAHARLSGHGDTVISGHRPEAVHWLAAPARPPSHTAAAHCSPRHPVASALEGSRLELHTLPSQRGVSTLPVQLTASMQPRSSA
jgi:hypothetical protein